MGALTGGPTVVDLTYRNAISDALRVAMTEDGRVVLLGEDIAAAGGVFKNTAGLFDEFGPGRVRDTPISEQAIIGAAIGASMQGLRPVAEIMFADFVGVAFDQVANQLAKYRYLTGGQAEVPVTIRLLNGAGLGFGSQHSQPVENWFLGVAGLKIVVPSTPQDMHGLLRAAIADPDPVLVFEHKALLGVRGEVDRAARMAIGTAAVVRRGSDVTIVASQLMRHRAEGAAAILAQEGIDVELIDPRSLVPFDDATVLQSLSVTSRLICVQEGAAAAGWASALIARVVTQNLELLEAPPALICSPDTPVPFADNLEELWLPSVGAIVEAARTAVAY